MLALIAALLLGGPPAAAPSGPALEIANGRGVEARVETDGSVRVTRQMAASERPRSAMDDQVANAMRSQASLTPLRAAPGQALPRYPADAIRFSLEQPSPRDTLLVVENGEGRRLSYSAAITLADGRTMRTPVCDVSPNHVGYEHWSDAVVSVRLTAFRLSDEAGQPQSCEN